MTTSSDNTSIKSNATPPVTGTDEFLLQPLHDLEAKLRLLFTNACKAHFSLVEETHQNLISETERLWGPDAGVGILKMSRLVKTLNDYVEVGIPHQHKAVGAFITEVLKGLDEIKSQQPSKIKRPLSEGSLEIKPTDSKTEQEAKSGKKNLKSIGISPKVSIPLREVVTYHFSRYGRLRLLGIEHKVTAVVKEFLNAWSEVVYKSLKDPDKASDGLASLATLASRQNEFLIEYADRSAGYIAEQISADVHKVSILKLRTEQKARAAELEVLRTRLAHEKNEWGRQMKLWSANVVMSLQLSRLRNSISGELNVLKQQAEEQILNPLERELQKSEKLLDHISNLVKENRMEEASKLTVTLNDKVIVDELQLNESLQLMRHFTRKLPSNVASFTEDDAEVNIDAAYLTDYLVEMHLTTPLQSLMMEIPSRATSAISALTNNMKLMGFTLGAESDEAEGDLAVETVLQKCLESVEEAKSLFEEVREDFNLKFEDIKQSAFKRLAVTKLLEEAPGVKKVERIETRESEKQRFYDRWLSRTGLVIHKYSRIINTHKDELLYAEFKARNSMDESCHAVLRNFYESVAPSREVLATLPVYYRQLFAGKHAPRESLFIHREREIEQAKLAVKRLKQGAGGAIAALGDSLSGKSFFIEMVSRYINADNVYRIDPPPTGSTNPDNLIRIAAHQIGVEPIGIQTFGQAPKGSVFLMDDLELWWARHKDGWKTIELFCEVVERYSKDYVFITSINSNAYRLNKNKKRFANAFIETIPMPPFTLKKLEEALMERDKTGGLTIQLDGVAEENITNTKQRAFLESLLDKSDGNIGVAFNLWLGHINKVGGEVVHMKSGKSRELPIITDKLWLITLAQFVLHKTTGPRKLSLVLNLPQGEVTSLLSNMRRAALITDIAGGGFQLSPYMQPFIIKRLKKLKLI